MTSSLKFILIRISYRDNIIKWKLQKDTKSIKMKFIFGKSVRHGNVKIKNFLNALNQECTERA